MKPKILIIDTLYDDFLRTVPFDPSSTYERELRKVLDRSFATADFYSRNLRALGWDAVDVVANHRPLQELWMREHGYTGDPLVHQIAVHDPEVVFMQDLSCPLNVVPDLLAGQLSCPWPGDEVVKRFDVIFTSFPHYIPRLEALGVRAIYNPLAFEPSVLDKVDNKVDKVDRPHDVVFIGGVGNPSHWRYGMEVLETVAREIPTFKWWGYGVETLPANSALHRCYQGQAFGLDMFEIFLQSKIVLNRHGEVAEGYANNMRMFEATGCGAMLLTEWAPNLSDFFIHRSGPDRECITYSSPDEAVDLIKTALGASSFGIGSLIAANGQRRTLRDHTYARRMKTVSDTLMEMLGVGRLNEAANQA